MAKNARNAAPDAGKGEETDSSPELPQGVWSCRHLRPHGGSH